MGYINILYDAIESALDANLNIGQITSYGAYHHIDFQGPQAFKYTHSKAQLIQNTIDDIVRSLNYDAIVSTKLISLDNSDRYYKVRTTVVYSFDSEHILVCKGCKAFFLPDNPAQQYDDLAHYFNCPVCNKHYILPNFMTRKVMRGIIGKAVPFNLDNIQITIEDQPFQGKAIVPDVIVKYQNQVLQEHIDYFIDFCKDNYNVTKDPVDYVCGYILPKASKIFYTSLDLSYMDAQVLCYARNEIYAKHGYIFPSVELSTYFNRQPWYKTLSEYNENKREVEETFSYEEIRNIDLINTLESEQETQYIVDSGSYDYSPVYEYIQKHGLEFDTVKLASISIVGKWKYQGSILTYFKIVPTQISNCIVSDILDQVYDEKIKTPSVSLSIGDYTLQRNIDYRLSYEHNVSVGVGTVIIEGIGDKFVGTTIKTFNIVEVDLNYRIFISDIEDQIYTGSYIQPELLIMVNGLVLIQGKDYTISWSDNKNRGTATGIITGTGRKLDWTGTKIVKFNII